MDTLLVGGSLLMVSAATLGSIFAVLYATRWRTPSATCRKHGHVFIRRTTGHGLTRRSCACCGYMDLIV